MVPLYSFVCSLVLIHPIFNEWLLCARPARPMERSLVFKKGIERGTSQEGHGSSLHLRLPGRHWSRFSHFNHRKAGLRLYLECIALWFSSFTCLFCQAGGEGAAWESRDWEGQGGKCIQSRTHNLSTLTKLPAWAGCWLPISHEGSGNPWQLWLHVWITW